MNTLESVLMRWMKLELIIQSEISQKEKHQYCIVTHIYGIYKDGNDNNVCETAKVTQMYRTVFWTLWEKARVGWSDRIALKHVYCHMWNRWPVQVRCMRQGARSWYTAMTLRDRMGREGGAGFRMGNTYIHMADSCQCMAKPLQYCKVISIQLKWINFKK